MSCRLVFVHTMTPALKSLIDALDQEYLDRFGDIALSYRKYHGMEGLLCAVLLYSEELPIGCGCIQPFDTVSAELKRVYVAPAFRRQGMATQIVRALERAARKHGFQRMVLKTGSKMPQALSLYEKLGFRRIENYGGFAGDPLCVCMEKAL